jgi:lysophospholipase L1-like esterase
LCKLDADISDGLHLSAEGYAVIFGKLKEVILAKWPEMEPEKMHMPVPQ